MDHQQKYPHVMFFSKTQPPGFRSSGEDDCHGEPRAHVAGSLCHGLAAVLGHA
jgi:hypothetical protein